MRLLGRLNFFSRMALTLSLLLLFLGAISYVLSFLISAISGGFFTVAAWFINLF